MQHTKIYEIQQKQFLRGKFLSDLCLPQEIIKASNNLILYIKELENKKIKAQSYKEVK